MLFAQGAVSDSAPLSFDYAILLILILPIVVCILVVLFIVVLLRHLRFNREKLHDERLKMIDTGYPLEEPESPKRQQKYMHNAFWISFWMVFGVPFSAFSAAAAATGNGQPAGYLLAIWVGASAATIAAVVCAAVLMIHSRSRREDDDDLRLPIKKPHSLDR